MSFNDDKLGEIFPKRTGTPSGTANERQMLDTINGASSFRTRIQTAADGTETMLRTKNGMPRFETSTKAVAETKKSTPRRTFVFADRAAPTLGRVANRAAANVFGVIGDITTSEKVTYSVLYQHTDARVLWNDVARFDDKIPFLNGQQQEPNPVSYIAAAHKPGLPFWHPVPHGLLAVSQLVLGTNDEYTIVGTDKVYKVGVATAGNGGTIYHFTDVSGAARFDPYFACGVYQTFSDNGNVVDYHFNWQGLDPDRPVSEVYTCYALIQAGHSTLPSLTTTRQTVTTLRNIEFPFVSLSNPGPSDSDIEIADYYTYIVNVFAGVYMSLMDTVTGIAPYAFTRSLMGQHKAYASVRTDPWSKSIEFNDDYEIGADVSILRVSRTVAGSEGETIRSGGAGTVPGEYYVPPIGSDRTWSRSAVASVVVTHEHSANDVYRVDFSTNSTLSSGKLSMPNLSWNWDAFDQAELHPAGASVVFMRDNAEYSAQTQAYLINSYQVIAANQARDNADARLPTTISVVDRNLTYDPLPAESGQRTDSITLTASSMDYIYYDPVEDVSLALVATVTCSKSNTIAPISIDALSNIFLMPTIWTSSSTGLRVEYQLNVRGVRTDFPVYENPTCWEAATPVSPVLEKGAFDLWEKKFSGAHIPGPPAITFCPPYMSQGNCPWIAYTTLAEEASGVTPEFYIDVKLLPFSGTNGAFDGGSYGSPVIFAAHHLLAVFSNYMGANAPGAVFDDVIFPEPTHIRMAKGFADNWPEKLGSPFTAASHVTITRI